MARTKALARSRRIDKLPGLRLNLEVLGAAFCCAALLLALALIWPHGAGAAGVVARYTLHLWFGSASWLAVAALAVVGAIVFLELRVPAAIAGLSACAAGAFLALDGWLGMSARGGIVGNAVAHGAVWAFGSAGAPIVFGFLVLAFVVTPTGISLKKTFGHMAWAAARVSSSLVDRAKPTDVADRAARGPIPNAARVSDSEAVIAAEFEPPAVVDVTITASPATEMIETPVPEFVAPVVAPPAVVQPPALQREPETVSRVVRKAAGQYRLPDFAIFDPPEKRVQSETSAALVLEETLASFGVTAKVTHIERGPSVTRYELTPGRSVKVSSIKALSDNIQLALAAQTVRIEAPIPGKAAVGVEVPNTSISTVAIREILDHLPKGENQLSIGLGKDITGRPVVTDLTRMPHLLVAGATGSGKSVCLNVIISSLLATRTPDYVQLVLIDPKRVELAEYTGVPHLIGECITDPKLAAGALYELTREMDARYERFADVGVRKIEEYNAAHPDERLPYIVVAIDELADLMLVAPTRVETSICRIAQLARATGIHLVIATQRPSVDVITGLIKANIPSRIAFAVSSQVDSRTILDMAGAERLLGRGDMLFLPIDAPKPIRVQGALVTGAEIERLAAFWREQGEPENRAAIAPVEIEDESGGPGDALAFDAAKLIIERQMASVALMQAELKIGHPRAVRLMKILEHYRVVGPAEGTKPRKILIGTADLDQLATLLAPREDQQPFL